MLCRVERLGLKQIECRRGSHDELAKQPLKFRGFLTAMVTPVLMPTPVTAEPVIPRIQEMAS